MTTEPTRAKVRNYRDLMWQKALILAVEAYQLARALRASERYVLKDQVFRASVSVPANIAEGQGRLSKGDCARHLGIARGSLLELETLLHVATAVGHLTEEKCAVARELADEIGRMLWPMMNNLGARRFKPRTLTSHA